MPFPAYRVNISISGSESDDVWDYTLETNADPGEIVASIQTLHPEWQEIHIERVYHDYTEKK